MFIDRYQHDILARPQFHNIDYDDDGIINLLDPDSDGDGYSDGSEINSGFDPSDQNSKPPEENSGTIYEDAEDGTINGWVIYDNTPDGATIENIYDADRKNNVIKFTGSGTSNGYRLREADNSKWYNTSQFVIVWSMKYSESFVVYIDVETTEGHRYLYYTPLNFDQLGNGEYVHHGLGTEVVDGKWHTYVRDLEADLADAQPELTILEVNGFLIRGSGRVDDIKLMDEN